MGSHYLYQRVQTAENIVRVREIGVNVFRNTGGQIQNTSTGFTVRDGKMGASFGFIADLTVNVVITKVAESTYDLQLYMNWGASSWFWAILILGLFLGGIPLLLLVFYFVFDPKPLYHQLLQQYVTTLPPVA